MREPTSIHIVSLALDAAIMRQTAIANNIANANVQGYQTIEVNFEQQLSQLSNNIEAKEETSLDNIHPYFQSSENQSPIDEQIALSVQNATHYRALIKGLNHHLAIMKLALQGNNAP